MPSNLWVNYPSPIKQQLVNQKMILSYRAIMLSLNSMAMKEITPPDKSKTNNTLSFFGSSSFLNLCPLSGYLSMTLD